LQFKEGLTLDKIFGSTYVQIDVFGMEDNTEEIFPSAPTTKRRGTLQGGFEIKEIEEEEEDAGERKNKGRKINRKDSQPTTQNNSILSVWDNRAIAYGEKFSVSTVDIGFPGDRSPLYGQGKTAMDAAKKKIKEAAGYSQSPTPKYLRISMDKVFNVKEPITHSKTPSSLGKAKVQLQPLKDPKIFCNGGFSISKSTKEVKGKEEIQKKMLSPFTARKGREIKPSQRLELSSEALTITGFKAVESLVTPRRVNHQEIKFKNQSSLLSDRIKNQEKELLSKYGAKFGISPQEFYGKQSTANTISTPTSERKYNLDIGKRISSPYPMDIKFGTLYKSAVDRKNL
jgi:hypothetical protein